MVGLIINILKWEDIKMKKYIITKEQITEVFKLMRQRNTYLIRNLLINELEEYQSPIKKSKEKKDV